MTRESASLGESVELCDRLRLLALIIDYANDYSATILYLARRLCFYGRIVTGCRSFPAVGKGRIVRHA